MIATRSQRWLPKARILHPWPNQRFAVKHPRWEPCARIAPAGMSAGGAQQWHPYRTKAHDAVTAATAGGVTPLSLRRSFAGNARSAPSKIARWFRDSQTGEPCLQVIAERLDQMTLPRVGGGP
jgi:hypothetical protein